MVYLAPKPCGTLVHARARAHTQTHKHTRDPGSIKNLVLHFLKSSRELDESVHSIVDWSNSWEYFKMKNFGILHWFEHNELNWSVLLTRFNTSTPEKQIPAPRNTLASDKNRRYKPALSTSTPGEGVYVPGPLDKAWQHNIHRARHSQEEERDYER